MSDAVELNDLRKILDSVVRYAAVGCTSEDTARRVEAGTMLKAAGLDLDAIPVLCQAISSGALVVTRERIVLHGGG